MGRATSGHGDRFELSVPDDQRYLLVAGAPGYAALALLVEGGVASHHHLVLAESVDLADEPAGCAVVGAVTGPQGPVPGALITLLDADGAVAAAAHADAQGRYRLDAASGGSVTITVAAPGLHPAAGALYLRPGAHAHDVRLN